MKLCNKLKLRYKHFKSWIQKKIRLLHSKFIAFKGEKGLSRDEIYLINKLGMSKEAYLKEKVKDIAYGYSYGRKG